MDLKTTTTITEEECNTISNHGEVSRKWVNGNEIDCESKGREGTSYSTWTLPNRHKDVLQCMYKDISTKISKNFWWISISNNNFRAWMQTDCKSILLLLLLLFEKRPVNCTAFREHHLKLMSSKVHTKWIRWWYPLNRPLLSWCFSGLPSGPHLIHLLKNKSRTWSLFLFEYIVVMLHGWFRSCSIFIWFAPSSSQSLSSFSFPCLDALRTTLFTLHHHRIIGFLCNRTWWWMSFSCSCSASE